MAHPARCIQGKKELSDIFHVKFNKEVLAEKDEFIDIIDTLTCFDPEKGIDRPNNFVNCV